MKVYTEVVMEWDEDKQEMVEVSSESYEYNGDVAQCGSGYAWGTHEKSVPGEKGRPGIAALSRKGLSEEYRHPSRTPGQGVITDIGSSGRYGVESGANVKIGDNLLGQYGAVDPTAGDLPETVSGEWEIGGKSYPRYNELMRRADIYDTAFSQQYYPEFMKKAYVNPAQQLTTFSEDPGMGGFEKLGDVLQRQTSDLPGGQEMDFSDLMSEIQGQGLGVNVGGWGGSPIVSKASGGDIGDAIDALVTAGEEYYGGKEEAEEAREKGMLDTKLQRQAILEGQAPAEVAREARIAKTGMAYSGPAERIADLSRGKEIGNLRDVMLSRRDIEDKYSSAVEGLESGFDESKAAFGTAIKGAVEKGGEEAGEYLSNLPSLPGEHLKYGMDLDVEQADEVKEGDMLYTGLNIGDLAGQTGGIKSAPSRGFYKEESLREMDPVLGDAETILKQANELANFLSQQTGQDIGSWIPTKKNEV